MKRSTPIIFFLMASVIDYAFLFIEGYPLSLTMAYGVLDNLPFWLAFFPAFALFATPVLTLACGPFILLMAVIEGLKSVDRDD